MVGVGGREPGRATRPAARPRRARQRASWDGGSIMSRTPSRSRAARTIGAAVTVTALLALSGSASGLAIDGTDCADLPDHAALGTALAAARGEANGGFDLEM